MTGRIRLGLLGCGSITRIAHLPASLAHPGVQVVALVDSDLKRAHALRQAHNLECSVASDYKAVLGEVDAVINALPNNLHAPVTLDAIRAGVHVLCEKPLAIHDTDARRCCEAGAAQGVVLAVGMNRRFYGSTTVLSLVLEEGSLGTLQDYNWEEGAPWDWATASGFYLSHAQAGGGVLATVGVHLLDRLVAWFGPVSRFEYQDDNWGSGIEANALLSLCHDGRYGEIKGRVRLSLTYTLKNSLLVRGSECQAEIPASDPDTVVLYRRIAGRNTTMTVRLAERRGATDSFYQQLDNFIECVRGKQQPVVDGWQGLQIVELVENCYAHAHRISEPWSEVCGVPQGVVV